MISSASLLLGFWFMEIGGYLVIFRANIYDLGSVLSE